MKTPLIPVLAVAASMLSAQTAAAHWFDYNAYQRIWSPLYPAEPTFLHLKETHFKPDYREEKVDIVVQRWCSKEVNEKVKVQVMVPKWEDETEMQPVYTPVIQEIEKDVLRCRIVPVMAPDPGTGVPCVYWQPQTYTERVKSTHCEYRLDRKEVTVKKVRWVPEDRVMERKRTEWYAVPETKTIVRRYVVQVPYNSETCTPVLLPHYGPPVCPFNFQ